MNLRAPIFGATIGLAIAAPAFACTPPALDSARTLADGEKFAVAWRFVPARPQVGEFFVVEFGICNQNQPPVVEGLRIDAIMPAHRHGMNFQPKIVPTGSGLFRAEGMMFHMPGQWQLIFEQRAPNGPRRLTTDIQIE